MNLYEILGVVKDATMEDIKKAYRQLANKYHPDKDAGDNTLFIKIKEAYEILSDPVKRSQYDITGIATPGNIDPEERKIAEAKEFIATVLEAMVTNNAMDVETRSVIDVINTLIETNKAEVLKNITEIQRQISKRNKIIARFKKKSSGENMFQLFLLSNNNKQLEQINKFKEYVLKMEFAAEFIKDYDYTVDVAAAYAATSGSMPYTYVSTNSQDHK